MISDHLYVVTAAFRIALILSITAETAFAALAHDATTCAQVTTTFWERYGTAVSEIATCRGPGAKIGTWVQLIQSAADKFFADQRQVTSFVDGVTNLVNCLNIPGTSIGLISAANAVKAACTPCGGTRGGPICWEPGTICSGGQCLCENDRQKPHTNNDCFICGDKCKPGTHCAQSTLLDYHCVADACTPNGMFAGDADRCCSKSVDFRGVCGSCSGKLCRSPSTNQLICNDVNNDNDNCGGCGIHCGRGSHCSHGSCVCPDGSNNTLSNPNDCGWCGTHCSLPGIDTNSAHFSCKTNRAGHQYCELNRCVPDNSFYNAYGGISCQSCCSHTCRSDGRCGVNCAAGQTSCGGHCVDLKNDRNNCGSCGHQCGTPYCTNGSCTY